ncbi:hypothetical protein AAMO2058_001472200 [Amorphochlora amoebiformis]
MWKVPSIARMRNGRRSTLEIDREEKSHKSTRRNQKSQTRLGKELGTIKRVIIAGLHDEKSSLNRLRGMNSILRKIWGYLLDLWARYIVIGDAEQLPFKISGEVKFPRPSNININMMPFVFGDKKSIPKKYRQYWPLVRKCSSKGNRGKVGYLTIHESWILPGTSQRRPGLHCESPGMVGYRCGGDTMVVPSPPTTPEWTYEEAYERVPREIVLEVGWGGGSTGTLSGTIPKRKLAELSRYLPPKETEFSSGPSTGIYMASTLSDTLRVFQAKVSDSEVISSNGDLEHIRSLVSKTGSLIKAGDLVWMTDRSTPPCLSLFVSSL